ncbi:MAG: hypothetical protein ACP5IB_09465 [Thermoplasmata archaeon]
MVFRLRMVRQQFDSIRADIKINHIKKVLFPELSFNIKIGVKKIRGDR